MGMAGGRPASWARLGPNGRGSAVGVLAGAVGVLAAVGVRAAVGVLAVASVGVVEVVAALGASRPSFTIISGPAFLAASDSAL